MKENRKSRYSERSIGNFRPASAAAYRNDSGASAGTWTVMRGILLAFILILCLPLCAPAAEVNFAYPKPASKKGLHVCPGMEEDALELGIKHTTINLSVNDFMPAAAYRNSTHCVPFTFEGTTYWFARNTLERYDLELQRLAKGNVVVTAILLLPNRTDDLSYLIYPAARGASANYYQWNMTDERAVRALRAIVTFFQRRYSESSGKRIVGWIVGNEVNNSRIWNWAGGVSLDTYMEQYASQVAAVRSAARKVYANARVYISLDHYWNMGNGSNWYAGKKVLTAFASKMAAKGLKKGTWCIAYHPYNVSEHVPDIMTENANVTNKVSTPIITMKNISVLTGYVKKKYSSKCRIILSEQGYSSLTDGQDTSQVQARSIALAYYIAQHNSMIDSLILHRQVDHTAEGEQYGLYTSSGGENAFLQKVAWAAYKYADTTKTDSNTKYAAKQAKKVTKASVKKIITLTSGKLSFARKQIKWVKDYTKKCKGFGALSGFSMKNGVCTLTHDSGRNNNVPWGVVRKGKINCSKYKKIGFGIRVDGSTGGNADIVLRLWSGSRKEFEAAATVTCGTANYLYVNLKKWKYRSNITKAEILIRSSNAQWSADASALIWGLGKK